MPEVLRAGSGEHAGVEPVTKLIVRTARISSGDPDRLDVTRQSGSELGKVFAPSWMLLRPFLAKRKADLLTERDWLDYVARYTDEMRTSFRRHGDAWESLLARERVVLVCFCTDPERCHRTVLGRDILTKLGAGFAGELP